MKTLIPILMMLALSTVVARGAEPEKPAMNSEAAVQTAKTYHFEKTDKASVNYLLYLPKDYQEGGAKRWPLILFLHGAGERGTNVWRVAVHGPPSLVKSKNDFPFIVVSPQCPEGRTWSKDVLLGLLDEIMADYSVDKGQVYLTGLSMGGYGTWDLGLSYPEKFAAIAPICGGGQILTVLLSSREKAAELRSLGIWAFHGAKDPVVPLAESERMVDAARRAGVKEAKLTVYPEATHNSWTETYNNPELYKWFLEHRRSSQK